MANQIELGEIEVDVVKKAIKNVHLSVYPPTGRVRISAPLHMELATIRLFAISKLNWIKRQQRKIREQERETVREYLDRESHFVWGKRYLLEVTLAPQTPSVELKHDQMVLTVRPKATRRKKREVVEGWYRELMRDMAPKLIEKWEARLNVKVKKLFVQQMKTKWGTCNHLRNTIRLNSELAKKPSQCLEYVVVHEMLHILEPSHNSRFISLMDQFMPQWKFYRDQLNRLPVRHEKWDY